MPSEEAVEPGLLLSPLVLQLRLPAATAAGL